MSILQFIQQSGNVVTRRVSGAVFQWMLLVSTAVDTLVASGAALEAQTRYVAVDGNDTTGTGSRAAPFLTIQAAMNSITDATVVKTYAVKVGPGVFATAFTVKNGCFIIGTGAGTSDPTGANLLGITEIAPTAAQVLAADWASATPRCGGIINCALSTALAVNYAAIGATGIASFLLERVITQSTVTFTGASVNSQAIIKDPFFNATVALTITDMGATTVSGLANDFAGSVVYNHAGAYISAHYLAGSIALSLTMNWTAAAITSFLRLRTPGAFFINNPTINGAGNILIGTGASVVYTMSDAANRLSFGNQAAATMVGLIEGTTVIECTPTAARVLTFDPPSTGTQASQIFIRNRATNPLFPIDFTFASGTVAAGSPTYCPAGAEVRITWNPVTSVWRVLPYVQSGKATLTNGVSGALIPADITANSSIEATLNDINGSVTAGPVVVAKNAERVIGTRVGGGGFRLTGTTNAGVTNAADNGIYDWHVNG